MNVHGDEPVEESATGLGDADLVAQVRQGLDEPYAELYRRHQAAALALARSLTEHSTADDIVSEAFEKLLQRIRGGGGPDAAFRPYLLRTVRTVAVDAARRTRRLVVAEDPGDAGRTPTTEADALVDAVHERTTLARAFAALPERWQSFLWLSFVDGADRHEIATILGINVGSVSALGYRAREGLRRAYLDAHLRGAPTPGCSDVWPLLAGAIRDALSPAQQAEVDLHIEGCDHCTAALAELEAVNTRFGAVLAPIVLGAAAPAYLAAVHDGGAATVGTAAVDTGVTVVDGGTSATGLKAAIAVMGKTSAAGVAVIACVSTVAVVALLAFLTAPVAREPSVAPRPGAATSSDGGSDARASSGDEKGTDESGSTDSTVTPAVATSSGEPTSSPTEGSPTGETDPSTTPTPSTPTTSGVPTGTASASPSGGPTSAPTSTTPTPPAPTGTRTPSPSETSSPTPTVDTTTEPTTSPSPTPPPPTPPATVDVSLSSIVVEPLDQTSYPVHLSVPVSLKGGTADLQMTLTIVGLNKFETTSGAGDGNWSCVAITPMAGAGKTAVVRCTLTGATPGDPLTLGLNIGYAGDGSVDAELAVLGSVDDKDPTDNTASTPLPPKN